jgi:hypothetical protein
VGSIVTSSQIDISATGSVQFTLGFDLSPSSASFLGAKVLPANGQLSADAVFSVGLDSATPVQVTVARNTANSNATQLINDINTALTAAGLVGVTAVDSGRKLRFTHLGTLAVIDIVVANVATNRGDQLGLAHRVGQRQLRGARSCATRRQTGAQCADVGAFFGLLRRRDHQRHRSQRRVNGCQPTNPGGPILLSDLFMYFNIGSWPRSLQRATSPLLPIAVGSSMLPLWRAAADAQLTRPVQSVDAEHQYTIYNRC